jgi:hypothetical protein
MEPNRDVPGAGTQGGLRSAGGPSSIDALSQSPVPAAGTRVVTDGGEEDEQEEANDEDDEEDDEDDEDEDDEDDEASEEDDRKHTTPARGIRRPRMKEPTQIDLPADEAPPSVLRWGEDPNPVVSDSGELPRDDGTGLA